MKGPRIRLYGSIMPLLIALGGLGLGCGGGGGHAVQVTVAPALTVAPAGPVTLNARGRLAFTATITGSTSTALTWTVDGLAGGNATVGTLVADGGVLMYTAPGTLGTHTVGATSVADARAVAAVTVTVAQTCVPAPASTTVLNVKDAPYNAKGDGLTDDTAALAAAVAAAAGTGGTVTVPPGTYLINPTANGHAGIRLGSHMTLQLQDGAVLQAMSTSTSDYAVVLASGITDATLAGGTILGNRTNNTITDADENGFGIMIMDSQQVVVDGVTTRDCWCDGVYVGNTSRNVTVNNVVADGNRRNAMSITSADGMVVRGSTFENTIGFLENGIFWSGGGVDIEPNVGETVAHVQFLDCAFTTNSGSGLGFGPSGANQGLAFVNGILVDGCTATGNGFHQDGCGIGVEGTSGNQVTNNTVTGTVGIGIYLRSGADNTLVQGNTVTGSLSAPAPSAGWNGTGIELYQTGGNTVTGNTITGNAGPGLVDSTDTSPNVTTPNTLSGNGS